MQTRSFPDTPDGRSPAGAEIRYLMEGDTGGMIHSTVPPGQVNRATVHATVSEFWHVLSGEGQIWRRDATGEETTVLGSGVSIDIPVGTAFQYRCTGDVPLQFNGWDRAYKGVRTDRYTYVVYTDTGDQELYDRRKDPFELANVAADPAYAAAKSRLAAELERLDRCKGRSCNVRP